jgi:hypothetical protein
VFARLVHVVVAADTPYEGGVFRVKLALGNEYPAGPPKGLSSRAGRARVGDVSALPSRGKASASWAVTS